MAGGPSAQDSSADVLRGLRALRWLRRATWFWETDIIEHLTVAYYFERYRAFLTKTTPRFVGR